VTGWRIGLIFGVIFHPFACMAVELWHAKFDGRDDA
jgi:hypothetical protein